MARHKLDRSWERLCALLSQDATEQECAAALGTSSRAIRRWFRLRGGEGEDFVQFKSAKQAAGRAQLRAQLAQVAAGQPVGEGKHQLAALTAQIWLSKQRLGYSDGPRGPQQAIVIQIGQGSEGARDVTARLMSGERQALPSPSDRVLTEDSVVSPIPPIVPPSPSSDDGQAT